MFATSRDVAEYFEKNHRDVLRCIDDLVQEGVLNFEQGHYTLETTGSQQHRFFEMDRDGFTLLAMGFNGPKALKFKLAYIAAFNEAIERLKEFEAKALLLPIPSPCPASKSRS